MPSWKGWSESEVRQSNRTAEQSSMAPNAASTRSNTASCSATFAKSSTPPPVIMGFTPINASRSSALHTSPVVPPSEQRSRNVPTSPRNDRSGQTKSIASEYLGRGDEEISVPAAAQTNRATRASAKKRAATTNDALTRKRRKTSDISDSMPVAKPKQTKGKAKTKTANNTKANASARIADAISCQPVPLFSSSTSMETLSAPSQQTSFGAAKASRLGTTLYHRSQCPGNAPSSSLVSQPWLESQADKTQAKAINTSSGAATHRGQAEVRAVSDPQNRSPQESTSRVAISRTLSEDFIPADGLEDDLALLDFIEAATQKTLEMTPDSTSPASVRQSEPKKATVVKTPKRCSTAAVGSSRTLSEDFLVGDDAEIEEVLKFTQASSANAEPQTDAKQVSSKRIKGSGTAQNSAPQRRESATLQNPDDDLNTALAEEQTFRADGKDNILQNTTTPLDVIEVRKPPTPPPRQWKLNMREVDENQDHGGALFSDAEKKILDSLKANTDNAIKPTVRTPFPRPILDRSPLFGASSGTMLRTCFRIGEALKEGIAGIRSNNNIIIELYARVKSSYREGRKQHFVFHDLYHDRPPYLEGTCELWSQTKLWELDARGFLAAQKRPEGVMCRSIARMKREESREGKIKGWRLVVFSIWEARWDDIDSVEGIYGKERYEAAADDD